MRDFNILLNLVLLGISSTSSKIDKKDLSKAHIDRKIEEEAIVSEYINENMSDFLEKLSFGDTEIIPMNSTELSTQPNTPVDTYDIDEFDKYFELLQTSIEDNCAVVSSAEHYSLSLVSTEGSAEDDGGSCCCGDWLLLERFPSHSPHDKAVVLSIPADLDSLKALYLLYKLTPQFRGRRSMRAFLDSVDRADLRDCALFLSGQK